MSTTIQAKMILQRACLVNILVLAFACVACADTLTTLAISPAEWNYSQTQEFPPHPWRADPQVTGYDTPTPQRLAGLLRLQGAIPPHAAWRTAPTTEQVRHFRIAFKRPMPIGTIIGNLGDAEVSYLRRGAPYPGDVTDDSVWITVDEPQPRRSFRAVTFPPVVKADAIRLTFRLAQPPLKPEPSVIEGLTILKSRLFNNAPLAIPLGESAPNGDDARAEAFGSHRLNDGTESEWRSERPADRPIAPHDPAWVTLRWPTAQKISGVWLVNVFGKKIAVDVYKGVAHVNPQLAPPTAWEEIVQAKTPVAWRPAFVDFGVAFPQTVQTTAIRVRIVEPWTTENDDITYATQRGFLKNIARIGEVMTLEHVEERPTPSLPTPPDEHPPYAVRYDLAEDSIVTLVVNNANGKRVRNLTAHAPRQKGANVEWWDGRDENGRLVPAGDYVFAGVMRNALHLRYQFSNYWSGKTPWLLPDKTGGWLSDHAPPSSIAVLGEKIFVGADVAESGDTIMALDGEGRKLWGAPSLDSSGAGFLCTDGKMIYVGSAGGGLAAQKAQVAVTELDPSTYKFKRVLQLAQNPGLAGIAVGGETLFVAFREQGKIVGYDLAKLRVNPRDTEKSVTVTFTVAQPGALWFDTRANTLLAISGAQVVSIDPATGATKPVVATGLEEPQSLCADFDGNLFVSDGGQSQQVKMFLSSGELVRAVGEAGGRTIGVYKPARVENPRGIGVDGSGRLWVAEASQQPKRVSVWNVATGELVREFPGGVGYGGGMGRAFWLDPQTKRRAYYNGMEFKLDWEKGESALEWIFYRPGDKAFGSVFGNFSPDRPLYYRDRKFMVYDFSLNNSYVLITEDKGGFVQPVACVGDCAVAVKGVGPNAEHRLATDELALALGDREPSRFNFSWSDHDGDGKMKAEEFTFHENPGFGKEHNAFGAYWGNLMGDDMSLLLRGGAGVWRIPVSDWAARGAPIYDLAKAEAIGPLPAENFQSTAALKDGSFVCVADPILGVAADGSVRWSYANPWPGVHGSRNAPSPRPGRVIGAMRVIGRADVAGLGEVFAVNGNKGELYLFTADGLLVATLFKDCRVAPWWNAFAEAKRGMLVDDISLQEECFGPTFTRTVDGHYYFVCGHNHASIVELEGLDTVSRFEGKLTLAPWDLYWCEAHAVKRAVAEQAGLILKQLQIKPGRADLIDGDLRDWRNVPFNEIRDDNGRLRAKFALRWDDDGISLAAQVWDRTPLQNRAEDLKLLFKGGDCVDLQLGLAHRPDWHPATVVAGDVRVLFAMRNNKPVAVIYRYVVAGTAENAKAPFASTVRTLNVDVLSIWDEPTAAFRRTADGYTMEAKVSWERLGGTTPKGEGKIALDCGIIFSGQAGDGVLERTYWSNPTANIVSDLPGEVEVRPSLWGWGEWIVP